MEEVWKDIEGYEGIYQVSSFGRVRSLDRIVEVENRGYGMLIKGGLMKPKCNETMHLYTVLAKNGKRKQKYIHRLVAEAFIPNPDNLGFVNHINEIPYDNRVENLEWCNQIYNITYGTGMKRASKTKAYIVLKYDLNGNFIKRYIGLEEAAKDANGYSTGISAAMRHNRPYKGYIYRIQTEI